MVAKQQGYHSIAPPDKQINGASNLSPAPADKHINEEMLQLIILKILLHFL